MLTPETEADLRSLVGPFVDAGTTLLIDSREDRIHLAGQRRFNRFAYDLVPESVVEGDYQVRRTRRKKIVAQPLRDALIEVAKLDLLARAMNDYLKTRVGRLSRLVESRVREVGENPKEYIGVERLRERLSATKNDRTTVLYLRGRAGAGKSWTLMATAAQQAQAYLEARSDSLILYVDAQGVNLRTVGQQIAHQLDLYNGILRHAEVTPLARLGALSVIIDGFDELITTAGTNDTARALFTYIEQFRGQGTILASGRASLLNRYRLEMAGATSKYPFEVHEIETLPWSENERRDFCALRGQLELSEPLEEIARSSEANEALLSRPFLASKAFEVLAKKKGISEDDVLASIEDAFVERERTEKLVNPADGQPILDREQFEKLLFEVALEMWRLRENSIDTETAETVAELFAESLGLHPDLIETLRFRIASHALLEPENSGDHGVRIRFPHEILFARAIARVVVDALVGDTSLLRSILRVAPLNSAQLEQIEDLTRDSGASALIDTIARSNEMASKYSWRTTNIRENLGRLAATLASLSGKVSTCRNIFTDFVFVPPSFSQARLGDVRFERCEFRDLDARSADWHEVEFVDCLPIDHLTVQAGQNMPPTLPIVNWLTLVHPDAPPQDIRGTTQIRGAIFGEIEQPEQGGTESPLATSVLEMLAKLASKSARNYWFSRDVEDADSGEWTTLKSSSNWPRLLTILEEHNLITKSVRPRRGPNPQLIHLARWSDVYEAATGSDPSDIDIAGVIAAIRELS